MKLNKEMSLLSHFSINENKISLLYLAYADKFPKRSQLWEKLAKDEKRHSALLADLDERFGSEIERSQVSENAWAILDYIGNFIDNCFTKINKADFTFEGALNDALCLEQSMIEKKNFEIFPTDNSEIKGVLEKLNIETEGHRRWLEQFTKGEFILGAD
jgi:rubrerythrin